MEINATAISQAAEPMGAASAAASGFAQVLGTAQSGAPPGPEPPPTIQNVGEEVANLGPIALSRNPDFSPQYNSGAANAAEASSNSLNAKEDRGKKAASDASQAILMMSATLAASAFATPTVVPPQALVSSLSSQSSPQGPVVTVQQVPPTKLQITIPVDPMPSNAVVKQAPRSELPIPGLRNSAVGTSKGSEASSVGIQPPVSGSEKLPPGQTTPPPPPTDTVSAARVLADTPADVTAAITAVTTVDSPQPVQTNALSPLKGDGAGPKSGIKASQGNPATSQSSTTEETAVVSKTQRVSAKDAADNSDDPSPSTAKTPEGKPEVQANPVIQTGTQAASSVKPGLKPNDLNLVVRQIADRIELLAATQPKNGITIQLQPDSLGSITMTVKSLAGSVEAHISASNDSVRAALEQNRPMLNQAMTDRGLKLDAVSIAPQAQTSTSSQRQAGQQQQEQAQRNQNFNQSSSENRNNDSTIAHRARLTIRSIDGVDLWI